jgi:ATP-binding cassette subfamily C (CFTR/MRP) protein 1
MEGRVLEQGSFSTLSKSGDYIRSLALNLKIKENTSAQYEQFESLKLTPEAARLPSLPDQSRQAGDLSMYKYYASSMGWLGLFMFGSFVATKNAVTMVQCMFNPHHTLEILSLTV